MHTQEHKQSLKTKKPLAREKSIYARYRQQILRQSGYLISIELHPHTAPHSTSWALAQGKIEGRLRMVR